MIARRLATNFENSEIIVVTHWKKVFNILSKDSSLRSYYLAHLKQNDLNKTRIDLFEKYLLSKDLTLSMIKNIERFDIDENYDMVVAKYFSFFDEIFDSNTILLSNQVEHFSYWLASEILLFNGGKFFGFSVVGRPEMYTQVLKDSNSMYDIKNNLVSEAELDRLLFNLQNFSSIQYMEEKHDKLSFYERFIQPRLDYLYNKLNKNYFLDSFPFFGRLSFIHLPILYNYYKYKYDNLFLSLIKLSTISKRLVLFPMHLQPEASIDIYSPFLRNQINVIERISDSLGHDDLLIVKMNPKLYLNSYEIKLLNKLKNVKILEINIASKELLKFIDTLIIINGTMALEYLANGKRVIILGSPPYKNYFSGFLLSDLVSLKYNLNKKIDFAMSQFRIEYKNYIESLISDSFYIKIDKQGKQKIPFSSNFVSYIECILKDNTGSRNKK
jgi:hypothetical protein